MKIALWIGRYLATSLLSFVLFSSFLTYMLVSNFAGKLLDDTFYSAILVENDTYSRVYDEVLSDPGIRKYNGDLTWDLQVVSHQDLVGLTKEIVPPSYVQEQVEGNLAGAAEYFNDERSTLEITADLDFPLDRVKPSIFSYVDGRIDSVDTIGANTNLSLLEQVADLERLTEQIVLDLATGNTPEVIPSIGIIPREFRDEIFDNVFLDTINYAGIDPRVTRGLEANFASLREEFIAGDTRQFLKDVAHAGLNPLIDQAIREIRANLDDQGRVDLLAMLIESNPDISEDTLRTDLETTKEQIARAEFWGTKVAPVVGIAAGVLLFLVYLPSLTNALRWPGLVLFIDGTLLFVMAKVLENILPDRLAPVLREALSDSPEIPLSAVALISDLVQSFNQRLFEGMGSPALIILAVGATMFVASFFVVLLKRWVPSIR